MSNLLEQKKRFREKAEAVSAVVADVGSEDEAWSYILDICEKKPACELLVSGCEESLSRPAQDVCDRKLEKVIAAPGISEAFYESYEKKCRDRGVLLIRDGLRQHLAGIDIGVTPAEYGIAATGSLVLDSTREDIRLTTMISEIHMAILPVSRLVPDAFHIEKELMGFMNDAPGMTAFITGPSRTADIERVLAIGVHGPLELHVLLLEDA